MPPATGWLYLVFIVVLGAKTNAWQVELRAAGNFGRHLLSKYANLRLKVLEPHCDLQRKP